MSSNINPPRLAAVIGWPITHSLSPLIHRLWAEREGRPAWYIPIAVEPTEDAFKRAADHLQALGFAGMNVTLPHKEHALRYCTQASDAARAAGAANMVSFTKAGPFADNSDQYGFIESVRERLGKKPKISSAYVIGAGGASRGVVLALKNLGAERITIVNRTWEKAKALAEQFNVSADHWNDVLNPPENCDFIVNTTTLGAYGGDDMAIDLSRVIKRALVADINYTPLQTGLLKKAQAQNLKTMDGLSMLMHQAAPGYKQWLGQAANVDSDLRLHLEKALQEGTRL